MLLCGRMVIRDARGAMLMAAGYLCDETSILQVERRGAWEALRLCPLHFSGQLVWLEGNALVVIKDLSDTGRVVDPSVFVEDDGDDGYV